MLVVMIVTCVSDTLAVHDCPEVGHTAHGHVFAQHVEGSDTTCRQPHTHSSVRHHGEQSKADGTRQRQDRILKWTSSAQGPLSVHVHTTHKTKPKLKKYLVHLKNAFDQLSTLASQTAKCD